MVELPPELHEVILGHLAAPLYEDERQTADGSPDTRWYVEELWQIEDALCQCLKVSRHFYDVALPLLYHTFRRPDPDADYRYNGDLDSASGRSLERLSDDRLKGWLAAVMRRDGELLNRVRSVSLRSPDSIDIQVWSILPRLTFLTEVQLPMDFLALDGATSPDLRPTLTSLAIMPSGDYDIEMDVDPSVVVPRHFDLSALRELVVHTTTENRAVVPWLCELEPLTSLYLQVSDDVNLDHLEAILAHHGPSLVQLSIACSIERADPAFSSLASLCPGLRSLTWDVTTDDIAPEVPPLLSHLLRDGHPTLREVHFLGGMGLESDDYLEDCTGDEFEYEARISAKVVVALLQRDPSLLPALERVRLPDICFPAYRIKTFSLINDLGALGLIDIVDGNGRSWMKPAGADCPLYAPFLLYSYD